jgi:hypothetical protein
VLGFAGYLVAAMVVGVVSAYHELALGERLVVQLAPPLSLLFVVTLTRWRRGKERIVFYQVAATAVLVSMAIALVAGMNAARVADYVVTGIATFLVFGRVGCFHVACCFGRFARWGVCYGEEHVAQGLSPRFVNRPLLPVQLIEATASAVLAIVCATHLGGPPGTATVLFTLGYASVRFVLELVRGDAARPLLANLSEAQWCAVLTACAVGVVIPTAAAIAVAGTLVIAATFVSLLQGRPRSRLRSPQHVAEIDRALDELFEYGEGTTRTTRLGFKLSLHVLPDMRVDVIWSHPALESEVARALASQLFLDAELVPARAPHTMHVLVPVTRSSAERGRALAW